MAILSIQSHVSKGYVGNSVAVFTLQAMGIEVWPVHTVQLSNHPGYPHVGGAVTPARQLIDIFEGLDKNGWFSACDVVLSGYMGSVENGHATLDVVSRVKSNQPNAMFVCDPVMGDTLEGAYVNDDLIAFYRQDALAYADVMTPNLFELSLLDDGIHASTDDVLKAARRIIAQGPKMIIVTSVICPSHPDRLGTMLVTAEQSWSVWVPRVDVNAKGVGDVFSALWTGHSVAGRAPEEALKYSVSGVAHLLQVGASGAESIADLPILEQMMEMIEPDTYYDLCSAQ